MNKVVGIGVSVFIAAVVFAAFSPALDAGFVNWDDDVNITGNENYRGLAPSNLRWMFTTALMGHYQPMAWMTLGLDFVLYKDDPRGYHRTSILIHAAGTVACYFVLMALLRWRKEGAPDVRTRLAAAAGALFFGIHPLRVESVAWVTERRDVLCVFFLLLSVLAYVRMARESEIGGSWRRWWALSCGLFAFSLLSKSLSIMFPFVLLALDALPLRRMAWSRIPALLKEKVPFLVLSVAVGCATIWSMSHLEGALRRTEGYPMMAVIMNASHALFFYFYKMGVPVALYPFYPAGRGADLDTFEYWGCLVAFIAVTMSTLALARRWPWAWWTWCGYVVLAFPTLGFFTEGGNVAGDRYTYVASLPLVALLAAGAMRLKPVIAMAVFAAILPTLGVLTFRQARVWKDSETLWTHTIAHDPAIFIAWYNRGNVRMERGEFREAVKDFDEAIHLLPNCARFYNNRGNARAAIGDAEGALKDYDCAAQLESDNSAYINNRGSMKASLGDPQGAVEDFTRALELNGKNAQAWRNRGRVRVEQRDWERAMADFAEALRADPAFTQALDDMARVRELLEKDYVRRANDWAAAGKHAEAVEDYTRAIGINPYNVKAFHNRGTEKAALGQLPGAMSDFTEALKLRAGDPDILANRAQARMALGDRQGAKADIEEALKRAPEGWIHRAQAEALLKQAQGGN